MAKGTLALRQIQLGDNADTSKNFVISVPAVADGTLVIERGNGTDVLSIAADGDIIVGGKLEQPAQSMVRLNTANGYGSTNTKIRRFANIVTNQGSDITYADSATLGASFTINTAGVYSISYTDNFNVAGDLGLSVDTTQPTVAIGVIPYTERLSESTASAAGYRATTAISVYLPSGTVIRPHTSGLPTGTSNTHFTITRVG